MFIPEFIIIEETSLEHSHCHKVNRLRSYERREMPRNNFDLKQEISCPVGLLTLSIKMLEPVLFVVSLIYIYSDVFISASH